MMNLYFVRHGESEANTRHVISNRESSFHLTPKGRQQAKTLAERIGNVPFQAMFSSPVLRARETADILSAALGIPYQVTEALREYDCGVLEEKSDEASWKTHHRYFEDWVLRGQYTNKPEEGECFLDIQDRFVPFMEGLPQRDKDQNILLVGHGGLYLLMLPLILTNIDHSFAISRGMGNAEYVLAARTAGGLVCLQWGQELIRRTISKTLS
jgi:broad specificity phosphatase PhoE